MVLAWFNYNYSEINWLRQHRCLACSHIHINTHSDCTYLECGPLSRSLLYFRPAKNAIICIVFPRPISSPIIPPACWQCNSYSQRTPVFWYLQSTSCTVIAFLVWYNPKISVKWNTAYNITLNVEIFIHSFQTFTKINQLT